MQQQTLTLAEKILIKALNPSDLESLLEKDPSLFDFSRLSARMRSSIEKNPALKNIKAFHSPCGMPMKELLALYPRNRARYLPFIDVAKIKQSDVNFAKSKLSVPDFSTLGIPLHMLPDDILEECIKSTPEVYSAEIGSGNTPIANNPITHVIWILSLVVYHSAHFTISRKLINHLLEKFTPKQVVSIISKVTSDRLQLTYRHRAIDATYKTTVSAEDVDYLHKRVLADSMSATTTVSRQLELNLKRIIDRANDKN